MKGKKILLGITGSIAAYKSSFIIREFVKAGADIKCIATKSALDFIGGITLSTLSKNELVSDLSTDSSWNNHVELGIWADLMLIAPATANTLSKAANGLCDNILLATYLSAKCPVLWAPAMDLDMWGHPSTQRNIDILESYGDHMIPVGEGELASGLVGKGRMTEPKEIYKYVLNFLKS